MASLPRIVEGRYPFRVTVAIAVEIGDLLAYNGSAWVLADADTFATLYARGIAGETVDGTYQTSVLCYKEALIEDDDAPYTAGAKQYLSATAGAHTETRPGAQKLNQVVGQALSTSLVHMKIGDLREVEVPIIVDYATSANALLDSGNFGGPTLDAQNEVCLMHAILPDNLVSIETAHLFLAAEATAGTPTITLAVSSAIDGAQWDAVTEDTIASFAAEGGAADEMEVKDISAGLNATNIARPGAILGLKAVADDAGTDIRIIFGGRIICNVV